MGKEKRNLSCDPKEVAVKSFFLGPAAENEDWLRGNIFALLESWFEWRKSFSRKEGRSISVEDQKLSEFQEQLKKTSDLVQQTAKQFEEEIPKYSPRYFGHMFSEISLPALLGHILTLFHNPNNISPESSKVGLRLEKEAVDRLCQLVGFEGGVGHFTSGGTVANFEFLLRARDKLARDFKTSEPVLFVSASRHYSWPKAMHVLGIGEKNLRQIELDQNGRLSVSHLKSEIEKAISERRPILGVVAIAGTTELGTFDPLGEIAALLQDFKKKKGLHIWFHVDAAYGGFFRAVVQDEDFDLAAAPELKNLWGMKEADSVTLDPHKLGYVPYSSGTFLCRSKEDYYVRSFTGPYIDNEKSDVGNFTLEGSRSAAGAVATLISLKAFADARGYAQVLKKTLLAKSLFENALKESGLRLLIPSGLDGNILCFAVRGEKKRLSEMNAANENLFKKIQESKRYWISKTSLFADQYQTLIRDSCLSHELEMDCGQMTLLRLTLMNPFITSKEGSLRYPEAFVAFLREMI
jgi:glutamate/tyrosine decarboxylase-like PLP-dependent enzyme